MWHLPQCFTLPDFPHLLLFTVKRILIKACQCINQQVWAFNLHFSPIIIPWKTFERGHVIQNFMFTFLFWGSAEIVFVQFINLLIRKSYFSYICPLCGTFYWFVLGPVSFKPLFTQSTICSDWLDDESLLPVGQTEQWKHFQPIRLSIEWARGPKMEVHL